MKRKLLAFCWALLLVACGQGSQQAVAPTAVPTSAPTAQATAAVAPTAAATSAPPTQAPTAARTAAPTAVPVAADQFRNPVLRADFPDPHIIEVDGTYYAYATNGAGKNIQLATSTDLVSWQLRTDAMPALASWVRLSEPLVWAPEVLQIDTQFLLYYTARDDESNRQCVGVAVAASPEGKFRDSNPRPLVCQVEEGGTIDASPFRDVDGKLYLYFKNDGNCCGQATYLYVQEMAPDGLSLLGEPTQLVRNDRAWEGGVVEAPTMWRHEDSYYLFFSANSFSGLQYAIGYATCETALGPCQDAQENPILASVTESQPLVVGPGHQTIVQTDDGDTWLVYHVWEVAASGRRGERRLMWMDRLVWNGGVPDVEGPTTGPQARP
jgi:beta-xylosidase